MRSLSFAAIALALLPGTFSFPMYKRSETTASDKDHSRERSIPLLGDSDGILGNGCQSALLNLVVLSSVQCSTNTINNFPPNPAGDPGNCISCTTNPGGNLPNPYGMGPGPALESPVPFFGVGQGSGSFGGGAVQLEQSVASQSTSVVSSAGGVGGFI